jgi:hypothetical protein
MTVLTFDTLKFANRLKSAGVLPAQAEAEAEASEEIAADSASSVEASLEEKYGSGDADIEALMASYQSPQVTVVSHVAGELPAASGAPQSGTTVKETAAG